MYLSNKSISVENATENVIPNIREFCRISWKSITHLRNTVSELIKIERWLVNGHSTLVIMLIDNNRRASFSFLFHTVYSPFATNAFTDITIQPSLYFVRYSSSAFDKFNSYRMWGFHLFRMISNN